ncbi:MAG: carboxymuconolactone decarboxylase family protein [Bryobacteraceae bacterium]
MPHIRVPVGLPGIRGLFAFRPETALPLSELAQVLLHDEGTLAPGERELIATYVSSRNDCFYCQTAHGAIAAHHLGGDEAIVEQVKRDFEHAAISDKLKALLAIAGKVQRSGKDVQPEDIERARQEGATDREIHDTVLIAAAFCMYNRYVDGLAAWSPADMGGFRERAAGVARDGYIGVLGYIEAARGGGDG